MFYYIIAILFYCSIPNLFYSGYKYLCIRAKAGKSRQPHVPTVISILLMPIAVLVAAYRFTFGIFDRLCTKELSEMCVLRDDKISDLESKVSELSASQDALRDVLRNHVLYESYLKSQAPYINSESYYEWLCCSKELTAEEIARKDRIVSNLQNRLWSTNCDE